MNWPVRRLNASGSGYSASAGLGDLLGWEPLTSEQTVNGIRFTPMRYRICGSGTIPSGDELKRGRPSEE